MQFNFNMQSTMTMFHNHFPLAGIATASYPNPIHPGDPDSPGPCANNCVPRNRRCSFALHILNSSVYLLIFFCPSNVSISSLAGSLRTFTGNYKTPIHVKQWEEGMGSSRCIGWTDGGSKDCRPVDCNPGANLMNFPNALWCLFIAIFHLTDRQAGRQTPDTRHG